ncbi:MAG: sensor domain-containing diguanylate cyclase [Thermodesulfobacteriota bacterium]
MEKKTDKKKVTEERKTAPRKHYFDKDVESFLEVGKMLTSTTDLNEILTLIVSKVRELVAAENWSLLLTDMTTGGLEFAVVEGEKAGDLKGLILSPGEGVAGHVVKTGEPVFVADTDKDPRFCSRLDRQTGFRTRSLVCVPLKIRNKVVGVLEIVNLADVAAFKKRYETLLAIMADYAAIAIENARYYERIAKMSITDEYTGLYNARYMHDKLGGLLAEAERSGNKVAVAFVDLDNFKELVDGFGHMAGSTVLCEVGQEIAACMDEKDILIKYGGDEYVMLLPGKGRADAAKLCEKIRERLMECRFPRGHENPVRLSASFGVASFPRDAKTKEALLLAADQRMFRVKKGSKNGVRAE